MDDIEERWTDRLFAENCKQRGFDTELKQKEDLGGQQEMCFHGVCSKYAVTRFKIGEVGAKGGLDIDLCEDHNSESTAFEVYDAQVGGE